MNFGGGGDERVDDAILKATRRVCLSQQTPSHVRNQALGTT